ncbi:hypothetical protein HYN69_04880 [Gemmobacter aquarius]|uniref:Uncharacterized protein n=1 Tax=Paragemmobacter aquarius TaxID=2169400 RepID=A0A2S0UJC8_9RHOB|nr:hypothetical protein [Gemmobacter aquarius]AWB47937.1 hypothetical protein HYN69_04880 [Gemmobacter aquarius]
MRRLLLPVLLATLAACTLSLPGKTARDTPAAAILPGPVEVTTLAAPPSAIATAAPTPTAPTAADAATPNQTPRPEPRPTRPATRPAPDQTPDQTPDPAATTPRPSPEQSACLAKGGIWSANGTSPLRTCVTRTRDAGKSCRKETDCDGLCLARSRTCAPVKPLFGCNPILQADGTEATLCID